MAEYTENYGLILPEGTDRYDREHQNDNMEIIDTELKRVDDKTDGIGGDVENLQGEIEDARHDSVDDVTYDSLADRLTQHKLDYVEHVNNYNGHINDYTSYKARLDAIDPFAIYGVSWDKTSSPILTRTDNSIGLVAGIGIDGQIVRNDFDRVQIFGEIHDVEDNYGNVFVRIPKFYIKKTDSPSLKTWQISKTKYKGFYLPWCFWDFERSRELPYFDFGKYKASLSNDNRLESIPEVYPLVNKNIVNFRTYAQANNDGGLKGYQQLDVHAYDVLQTLFYVEFATLHSQSIMPGYTSGQYTATHLAVISEDDTNRIVIENAFANLYRVGQAISIGTSQGGNQIFYGRDIVDIQSYDSDNKAIIFDGEPVNIAEGNFLYNTGWRNGFSKNIEASSGQIIDNNSKYPCMYRGIESPYGDVFQWVDGVNINDWQAWVALDAEDYASNVFAYPYRQLGYINHDTNGYFKFAGHDPVNPFAEFPVELGGSSSTYYADYYYQNSGQRIARVGGRWNSGSASGLSSWYLTDASSASDVDRGGRLLKKPL